MHVQVCKIFLFPVTLILLSFFSIAVHAHVNESYSIPESDQFLEEEATALLY